MKGSATMWRFYSVFLLAIATLIVVCAGKSCAEEPATGAPAKEITIDFPPALDPQQAVATMRTTAAQPLVVELVAAEPLVADPVAFDWGPDGRLWVVEMGDYPNGISWNREGDPLGKPGGRVKVLSDDDGDGRYDRASLFLDELPFPTGVKVWRSGVLVTAAPDILYAEDTDGDDRADRRQTLYRGFGEGNQQHRVNGLRWGLDNWLHVGNGDSGGTVRSLKTGEVVNVNGRDLRIRPDQGALDVTSGQTQYGRCRDDFGNWFGGNNSNPMWHYVLDDFYLRRNPHYAPASVKRQVSVAPGAAPVFPASRTLARFNDFDRANRFTSACSPSIYRDRLIGDAARTYAYVCEPVHNLVHREVLAPAGASFTSRRPEGEEQAEFLASTDNWFRPVMVRTGPDGAIWIADMYRFVIEHPKWIPAAWQQRLEIRAGADRGRIYRVRPAAGGLRPLPRLDEAGTDELLQALESPNGWTRDMAHQLLLWRDDRQAVAPLGKLALSHAEPATRLQALCVLDGLGAAGDAELLAAATNDPHPAVRRHALRLAEPLLDRSDELAAALRRLAEDADPSVRLQAAYSAGQWNRAAAGSLLARLARRQPPDGDLTAALLSSLNRHNTGEAIVEVLAHAGQTPPATIEQMLAIAAAMGDAEVLNHAVQRLLERPDDGYRAWQFASWAAVRRSLERRGADPQEIFQPPTRQQIASLVAAARSIAADAAADPDDRLVCIRLLSGQSDDELTLLGGLLEPQNPATVQQAAVEALARSSGGKVPGQLLADWPSHSPALRAQILDALLSRPPWTRALLAAVAQGDVQAAHLDARRRQQLLQHKDEAIRAQADRLFQTATSADRQQVIAAYQQAAGQNADTARGKAVFAKRCANCHRWEGQGHAVGPDLAALTDKSVGAMLIALLDPNRAVEDKFLDYVAVTNAGRQFTGIISGETSTSITLVGPEGKEQTVLRAELDEFRTSGKSLMPEGMEKDLTPQDVADVIAYLRSSLPPPKPFPGNQPQVAPVRDDGSIRLLAMHARIYGPSLVFEPQYRNLGYWGSPQDHAIWQLDVPRAGRYRVTLDYACHDDVAGNRYLLAIAEQTLGGVVPGTGSWDNYRSLTAGTVALAAGRNELVFRSDGPIRGALIDLRTIRLQPQ